MKYRSILINCFFSWILFTVSGCGEDSSSADDLAPQPPVPIARSDDAAYPQSGIRPEPTSDFTKYRMRIEWESNTETDVLGYIIRRGSVDPQDGSTYPVKQLEYAFNPNITEYFWIDEGLDNLGTPGANMLSPLLGEPRDYFWQIAAYDESGNRSEWSDTIRYTLIENPFDFEVERLGPDDYSLSWQYPTGGFLQYKVRVYSYYDGPAHVMWDPPLIPGYTTQESIRLNRDGTANEFEQDCTYVWQLNAIRDNTSGAAVFTTFIYSD
ncbi:hypothetical protein EH220_05495 [bacterium]|nr:MAG: hypothetical protein EH220_05495 [bacterium]